MSRMYWNVLQTQKKAKNQIIKFVKPDMFFVHLGTRISDIVLLEGILVYWMHDRRKVLKPTTKAKVLRIVNIYLDRTGQ